MRAAALTEERFLEQTKGHALTVIRDDGLYRHLRVGIPGTACESWHVITWPGYLAMVGDMGDWVFRRLDDMLEFFRSRDERLRINPGYWAEKLEAHDRNGNWEEFSIDVFRDAIREEAMEACRVQNFDEIPKDRRNDLDALLRAEDEFEAVSAYRDWNDDWLDLTDFWENNDCKAVRPQFLFACYAIAWTVKLYDALCATANEKGAETCRLPPVPDALHSSKDGGA